MKKVLSILILFFVLYSCSTTKYTTRYKRYFPENERELSINDLYNTLYVYEADSIPMEDWILVHLETKEGYIVERSVILKINKSIEYLLIHSTHVNYDTTFYEYEILRSR